MESAEVEHPSAPPPASQLPDVAPGAHRRFVDLLHDFGGVLWEMDAQSWRFTFVSERAERLFGYPVQRWYDEPTFWQDTLLHPEDRDWCVSFCSVASGQCRNHAFLYRASAADGRIIWVKDIVRVIADSTGRPRVMRGVMVDAIEEMHVGIDEQGFELDYDAPEFEKIREFLAA